MLYAAMLHAAARLDAGGELTELEASLVGTMTQVLPEEEARELGRVYEEETSAPGAPQLFPDSLTRRPVTKGYTSEDLMADLAAFQDEIAAQPNVNIIDLDAPEGGEGDSDAFVQAMSDYGYGATLVTASGHQDAWESRSLIPFRLVPSKMYCVNEDNHEISGSDEIYWALAAGADGGEKKSSVTRTYGDVDRGETHILDMDHILYDGPVDKVLACNIECWEADEGVSDQLVPSLTGISNRLKGLADDLGNLPGKGNQYTSMYMAGASAIADLIASIIGWLADDFVAERTIEFDRAAMAALEAAPGREMSLDFTQQGGKIRQRLTLRAGPPLPAPKISNGWPGLRGTAFTTDIGAACPRPGHSSDLYLFKGDSYVRYALNAERITSGPATISNGWPGLRGTPFTTGIDAACLRPGSSTELYLFKGDSYVRYDTAGERIVHRNTIAAGWPGLSASTFKNGIHAAANVLPGRSDVWLFRGNMYLRYDIATERITSGPHLISHGFAGLKSTPFEAGIDAGASVVPGNAHAVWLFKGDAYYRYPVW
ncbi:hypothetical protein [Streptomyces sp. NPDC002209]|uniref:hypothetical protein n=1 Tax=Streptomyces sp. NPDC002209 TaxID=3364638 RepID=UPI0036AC43AC